MKRLVVGFAVLAFSSPALAAPAPSCTAATMTPRAPSIPANLPAFAYSATNATVADVQLRDAAGNDVALTLGPITGGLVAVKPAALVAGTSYKLTYSGFCNAGLYPVQPVDFVAAPAAPLPTTFGVALGATTSPQGSPTALALQARFTLDETFKPWLGVHTVSLTVDGRQVLQPQGYTNAAGDFELDSALYCDELTAGSTHTFRVQATLPFAPAVTPVDGSFAFTCPASTPNPYPSYNPSGTQPSPYYPTSRSNDSFGCGVGGTRSSTTLGVTGLLLALAAIRRRKTA